MERKYQLMGIEDTEKMILKNPAARLSDFLS